MADDRYFLGPIFGPRILLSVHHLWAVPDDAYIFVSDSRTQNQFFFSVYYLWIVNEDDSCYVFIIIFRHCLNLVANLTFNNHFATEFTAKNYLDCSVEFF